MPKKNESNLQKILKLSYVIIFALLSYYILIGSKYDRKSVYDRVDKIVQNSITNHWFKECLEDNIKEIGCKPTRYKKFQVNGRWISADIHHKRSGIMEYIARNEYNKSKKPGELKLVYFNDSRRAFYLSRPITKKIIWGLFILTLPLIWFSRGFSLSVVNSIMKLFNKGWKKL